MKSDSCGFWHSHVDSQACISCGRCDEACPAINTREPHRPLSAIWAKSIDAVDREHSSSGGVFALLARNVLSAGGIVVGAAWEPGCKELRHAVVEDASRLDSIMRSKYLQSQISCEVYEAVRVELSAGRFVLFAGTACQVAGMRSYLGQLADAENFLSVDVVCHGVPSPFLWKKWIAYRESLAGGEIVDVNFRCKATGWLSYSVRYEYRMPKDGSLRVEATPNSQDWYMRAFLSNASIRQSCLACSVKDGRCGSDVTLGDFWGIQTAHPEVTCADGVSAALANTEKGQAALDAVKPRIEWGASSFEKVLAGNPSLVRSAEPYIRRDEFLADFASGVPIANMISKWDFQPSLFSRVSLLVRGKLSGFMRRVKKLARQG